MSITYLPDAEPLALTLETIVHPTLGRLILKTADAESLIAQWHTQAVSFGWSKDSAYYFRKIWDAFAPKALTDEQVQRIAEAMLTLAESGVRFV